MAVNLLPQATAKDLKKADGSLRSLILVVVWVGILIAIFVVLLFNQGIENSKLKSDEAQRTTFLNQIQTLGSKNDSYYTLAYKTLVLSRIKTAQYVPSTIGDYIKKEISSRAQVQQYYFDAEGTITLQLTTDSYASAVRIWHDLLKDKTVVTALNLDSFSQDSKGNVSFQLKGTLNLNELYRQHGITK